MPQIDHNGINTSASMIKYKDTTKRLLKLSYPHLRERDFDAAIDYSIQKRFTNYPLSIENNYTNQSVDMSVLEMTDYIMDKEPICTMYGTLFKKHGSVKNPFIKVIQKFMDMRGIHKKQMYEYPKGSEKFEFYNLLQNLDKIDCNG